MEPFAFATKSGSVILSDTLDKFAIKSGAEESQQLSEDSFNYADGDGLKQPLYPPKMLAYLAEMNTYHAGCIKTKATDVGGLGWSVVPNAENPNEDNKNKLLSFFQASRPLFEDVATYEQMDKGSIGWGVLELIRVGNVPTGEPERFDHIPSHTVRIHKDKNKFMQTWDGVKKTWFKRIGYDKDVNKNTGAEAKLGSLSPELRAHEIIFDINYTPRSTYYGIPDSVP
ncbi:MAG: hypothetical protein K8E24_003160, partial [Methanobacterium paludis]|nr:hypothetical protein [Methanobacterium paludis]